VVCPHRIFNAAIAVFSLPLSPTASDRLSDNSIAGFSLTDLDSLLQKPHRDRKQLETDPPQNVAELIEKEAKQQERKRKKEDDSEDLGLLFSRSLPRRYRRLITTANLDISYITHDNGISLTSLT